jgi:hypothetical protein
MNAFLDADCREPYVQEQYLFAERIQPIGLNMPPFRETDLVDAAMGRLRERTGLDIDLRTPERGGGQRPDGLIQIAQGAHTWDFRMACKTAVDRVATLHTIQDQLRTFPGQGLLIAPYLGPDLARKCQEMGLPFLDAAGNAFLKGQGLYVLVTGQKPDRAQFQRERPMRAFDRAGLRVVFALLAAPGLLQAPYRDVAKAAGVALGTVGGILTDLRNHGFLVEDRQGERRWIDRQRVIQTWATNFPLRLRERLHVRKFRVPDGDWWKTARPEDFGGFWGGEIAAAKCLGDLVPRTATLYLPEDRNGFLAKHRFRADPQGPIEVLDAFWELPQAQDAVVGVVPPLLVYADLLAIGDPRTLEQARLIHDRYLA